jgi:hypothetical protein
MTRWVAVSEVDGLSVRLGANAAGRLVVVGLRLEAAPITAEMLRTIQIRRIEGRANENRDAEGPGANLPALTRRSASGSEAFSHLVAEHYKAWARHVPNPAVEMAARWNVKPPTMASWIREARLRGFLPAARRRKGGGSS